LRLSPKARKVARQLGVAENAGRRDRERPLMSWRRSTRWAIAAAFALAIACPVVTEAATTTRAADVPAKLDGVWHKNMTQADWDRIGVSRAVGIFTIVIKKTGDVIVYLPGTYRSGCSSCPPDFETTITTAGARLALGSVPVCSFKGVYGWTVSGRTLILKPIADKRCQVRETFFGGRWKR
jgi:hypothetical protein